MLITLLQKGGKYNFVNKGDYRNLFLDIKPIIKFNPFLKDLKISQSNFSYFLNGSDRSMSYNKLEELRNAIQEAVEKVA